MYQGQILTVLGPIQPKELGVTLTHDHILLDLAPILAEPSETSRKALFEAPVSLENLGQIRWDELNNRDNCRMIEEDVAIDELIKFKRAGGNSIVDPTNFQLDRDPNAMKRISIATGLNIILGCGHYVAPTHPPDMNDRTVEQLADEIVEEMENGILTQTSKYEGRTVSTQVRPGIIGELGTSSPITPNEEKVLRGGAKAQQTTGAIITVHLHPWHKEGLNVLDILEEAGADPSRVILDHLNPTLDDLDYHKAIGARGAYIEYDLFGYEFCMSAGQFAPRDWDSADAICELIEAGYIEQLLLSHDICTKTHLTKYGGYGYAHILEHVVPLFYDRGLTPSQVQVMTTENPRRALTFI